MNTQDERLRAALADRYRIERELNRVSKTRRREDAKVIL